MLERRKLMRARIRFVRRGTSSLSSLLSSMFTMRLQTLFLSRFPSFAVATVIVAALVPGLALSAQPMPLAVPEIQAGVAVLKNDDQRWQFIGDFAAAAARGDTEAALGMFVPAARQNEGDDKVRKFIVHTITPFFTGFDKLYRYVKIEPRTMPNGGTGFRYYTYFLNTAGERQPFDIIVMEDQGRLFVANFNARGCVPGKHPICDKAVAPAPVTAPKAGTTTSDSPEIVMKKIIMLDFLEATCGKINPEANRVNVDKMRQILFPAGLPRNAQEIRDSEPYKALYETAAAAALEGRPPLTYEQCAKL